VRSLRASSKETQKRNLISVRTSSDLINRNFTATGPNHLWVTDITEHPMREGPFTPAWSWTGFPGKPPVGLLTARRRPDWQTRRFTWPGPPDTQMNEASFTPTKAPSQFTSWAFTRNVDKYGLRMNLGTVGDCCNNALIESSWARMQTELLNLRK